MLGAARPDPFDPGFLHLTKDLNRRGIVPTRATHHHVRHGVWIERAVWAALTPEQRHAASVRAPALRVTGPEAVCCRASSAAVWGLPRVEAWPAVARTHVEGLRLRGSDLVHRHLGHAVEPVAFRGLLLTPVARTVIDLARTESLMTAVAAADHALRHEMCTRAELLAEVQALPPRTKRRGIAQLVHDFADPDSMSAGESLSRVRMFQLGLPRPRLQVEREDDRGLIGQVDFDWGDVVGEFDGKVKYRIPEDADPADAGEIVWREKQREDRLGRQAKVARWTWAVAMSPGRLAAVLAEKGIRPQPRCTWFDGLGEQGSA